MGVVTVDPVSRSQVRPGKAEPLGPSQTETGLNLALWAPQAMDVALLFEWDRGGVQRVPLSHHYCSDGMWYLELSPPVAFERLAYIWSVDGRELLDPYSPLVLGGEGWAAETQRAGVSKVRRSGWQVDSFDWQGVRAPKVAASDRVVYELGVRGFTRDRSSGVNSPGSYRGIVEKIPYLLELGITTLQLMPVFEFDELEFDRENPETSERLVNLWGYSPISFFAPKASFADDGEPGAAAPELKEMVRECHRAGLEVFIDVVFNHTGEKDLGPEDPVYSWVALSREQYYFVDPSGRPRDVTGCGNTFNHQSSSGRTMVLDALRHWRTEYRIDGFRFDLAAALTRDVSGDAELEPRLIRQISEDPKLAECALIAEVWDAAGLYRLGEFSQWGRWSEWNGRYRDEVRAFVRGDRGNGRRLALRLLGSPDLYSAGHQGAHHSINYLSCHDGFPLADVVSYAEKQNLANGEDNRDGDSWSPSWNGGMEGPTSDPDLQSQRRLQVEMMLAILFVSRGTPMLLAGDEFGRSQLGNNNSYCQDNSVGWVDWKLLARNLTLQESVRQLVELRRKHSVLTRHELPDGDSIFGRPEVIWHGIDPLAPDWSPQGAFLAVQWLAAEDCKKSLYVGFNPTGDSVRIRLPEAPLGVSWTHCRIGSSQVRPSQKQQETTVELGRWGTAIFETKG